MTPISSISHIQLLCCLLDSLITPSQIPADASIEQLEAVFAFAVIWAWGSALFVDGELIPKYCSSNKKYFRSNGFQIRIFQLL